MSLSAGLPRVVRFALLAGVLALPLPRLAWPSRTLEAAQVSDAQVKAAFLFNFAIFVQWPEPNHGPLVIGIAGDDAFAEIVAQTVRGRNANARELQTRRLAIGDDPAGCHIVFMGALRAHDAAALMRSIHGPVLTVGETAQFLREGGMVRFYVESNKVRFQISQKTAEAAGLKVSSHVLTLAAR